MRVAVAGGGIAGLTAAIALARRGISVDLFERAIRLEEIGAGIQLSPNAMAVLERLDLLADLRGSLFEPRAIEIRRASNGALLASVPLGETVRRRHGAAYAVIHRADLQAGLVAAARREPRILLQFGTAVENPVPSDTAIRFSAGGRSASADVLVAADGVHSRLRTEHFGHPGPLPAERIAWRATIAAAAAPPGIAGDATGLWLGRGIHVVHYPVRAGENLNIVAIGPLAEATAAPPLAGFARQLSGLLQAVPAWSAWPLLELDATRPWVKGRAVLVGDAAHAILPSAAQGGAQAIEDAWVLAACLAAAPERPQEALRAFERARRGRVERIAREARRNMNIYGLHGLAAAGRDLAIRALPRRMHLSRLDWLYGWTPG